jgi:hypothetical protein
MTRVFGMPGFLGMPHFFGMPDFLVLPDFSVYCRKIGCGSARPRVGCDSK